MRLSLAVIRGRHFGRHQILRRSVRHVDRIAVVEHGAVVEFGSHEELMGLRGRYWTMFSLQAKRFAEGTPEEGEEEVTFDVLT